MRDHEPLAIADFNGYYKRGDAEDVPPDHFIETNNVQFTSGTDFRTRFGIDAYQIPVSIALDDVQRIHPYTMQSQQSLLVLTTGGNIHHVLSPTVVHLNILQKALMTDFNSVSWAGRAYITPFFTNSNNQEVGLQSEFLYVYLGNGVPARKSAGSPPIGSPLVVTASGVGFSELGFHLFAIVYETDTGYLTALGPAVFGSATSVSNTIGFDISNIPISPDSFVIRKHVVATKAILNYNGDQDGYEFFFVPGGDMLNAVTTKHVDFFDLDLLEEASRLIDNFSEIPAGVGLTTYHGRLVLTTTFTDISIAYVSHPGEPEAFDQIDGILIVPLDGNPLTNCQEFRDVLYLFKKTRTYGYSDNQDIPSTWTSFIVDEGIGAPVHGVSTVLDSGGVNVDFLLIADYSGIMLFNGAYTRPELSWKIRDFWFELDRTQFRKIELINDSISETLYCVLPTGSVLVGNYQNGMNAKEIRWSKWTFDIPITTIELTNTITIILGSAGSSQSGLYVVVVNKTNDTLYDHADVVTVVKIPDPLVRFAYTDVSEGENIIHIGSIRIRAVGTGNLLLRLLSLDDILIQTLVPVPMTLTTDRQPTRLCNFMTQRASLEIKTSVLNETFKINRIILYAKEVYTEFPSVQ